MGDSLPVQYHKHLFYNDKNKLSGGGGGTGVERSLGTWLNFNPQRHLGDHYEAQPETRKRNNAGSNELWECLKLCVWGLAHAVETGHLLNRSGYRIAN
jgi:hypothetical protein